MSMLPRLKPRCFYDLVIEVAIIRPGPIQGGMVHPYLANRRNPAAVRYPSPELEQVLQRTLGVPIFQEQVMQIAVVAAGFTPGEADGLRRSMAAWKRKGGLEPYRERLLTGMRARGYTTEFAEQIYRQIQGFGEYGFPESHSASFALLTYVSCWLKCHEPAAFFAALINSQPMGFYQPAQLTQEARRAGVTLLPPDVRASEWDCTLEPDARGQPAIRLGLRQVRGLAAAEAQRLIAARAAAAPAGAGTPTEVDAPAEGEAPTEVDALANVDALAHAADLGAATLQKLAAAGALAGLQPNRHAASWQALGVERLPGLLAGRSAVEPAPVLPMPTEGEMILADYAQLGLTTGRHPLALLRAALTRRGLADSQRLRALPDGARVRTCGLVTHLQRPGTASGVMFVSLEDEHGIINLILWPQVFEAQRAVALGASLLAVRGTLQNRANVTHVVVERLQDASGWVGTLRRRSRDFR
jgi:error-prone DNA polymerase